MATFQANRLSPASVTPVTNAETVVLTSAPYTYDEPNPFLGLEHAAQGPGQGVRINGIVNYSTTGTGTTQVTIRVRQGSLTGPVVGAAVTTTVTAATPATIPFDEIDFTRFAAGGGVYVVTATAGGATGNPTIPEATMCIQGA